MPYIDPADVRAPRKNWTLLTVEFSTGRGDGTQPGWSVATGLWDDHPATGVRWNGQDDETGAGNPQSRGHPTWFILPDELVEPVMAKVAKLKEERDGVDCRVWSPPNYSEGAWKVTIQLSGEKQKIAGADFVFFYPKMSNDMFRAKDGYMVVAQGEKGLEICGKFVDGYWEGDLYTYNLHTKAEAVSNQIREIIVASLKRQITDAREPNVGP